MCQWEEKAAHPVAQNIGDHAKIRHEGSLEPLDVSDEVSATARRHGISRSQLLQWRRSFRAEPNGAADQQVGFVPAVVMPGSNSAAPVSVSPADGGSIEIEFTSGACIRITGAVDGATLTAAIAALSEGRRR